MGVSVREIEVALDAVRRMTPDERVEVADRLSRERAGNYAFVTGVAGVSLNWSIVPIGCAVCLLRLNRLEVRVIGQKV
ncbi:hypothetical protein A3D85_01390 [Candidatus Amesbacteria bacterium RIFCSPHIGHO2_02_FULL_47_9]|uniref:Uncharacterized protein n=1 Tax=Candidatus Amesbacteria bacterium RIFCSPHIGHO2_01_FULL_48_32b TaxID=1797253 RepID=A0A1F4YDJ7_9BACT|nr:MAG: hypothetical protein A2876_02390 [Candidatus Amesbacteria bacterium RIFCSPHIGHO2_01_FULL_48_32b]OGD04743.1 MAG: hypothetical protein A3D85_01390 [Candidatus Amesbacteria bacterium RIFCSPHIGHO2_02_FULL_47_9]OGD07337.1 MAG: hypothetical protein A2899_01315 [Candidatus Amesbacteria bacterium RIFCSPLOWO2_01_FULL_49_25]